MDDLIISLSVSGLKKWKRQSGWLYLIICIIGYFFLIFNCFYLTFFIYKWEPDAAKFYLYWFYVSFSLALILSRPYHSYSHYMYGKELKIKISFTENTISGNFIAKNGDMRCTKTEISYFKECKKYYKVGRSFYNFFFIPKGFLSKEQIQQLNKVSKK